MPWYCRLRNSTNVCVIHAIKCNVPQNASSVDPKLTWRTCLNCSSKLQLLFCGGEPVLSRGGGELASLFEDEPGGVKEEDNPLADRFWGMSLRAEPPDNWGGKENDVFGGVWIPKRPWMYSGSYYCERVVEYCIRLELARLLRHVRCTHIEVHFHVPDLHL